MKQVFTVLDTDVSPMLLARPHRLLQIVVYTNCGYFMYVVRVSQSLWDGDYLKTPHN